MLKNNEMIELSGGEAIAVLKEVEYVMISLRKIASYYYDRTYAPPTDDMAIEYALETTRFIDQSGVMRRLSKARSII